MSVPEPAMLRQTQLELKGDELLVVGDAQGARKGEQLHRLVEGHGLGRHGLEQRGGARLDVTRTRAGTPDRG